MTFLCLHIWNPFVALANSCIIDSHHLLCLLLWRRLTVFQTICTLASKLLCVWNLSNRMLGQSSVHRALCTLSLHNGIIVLIQLTSSTNFAQLHSERRMTSCTSCTLLLCHELLWSWKWIHYQLLLTLRLGVNCVLCWL